MQKPAEDVEALIPTEIVSMSNGPSPPSRPSLNPTVAARRKAAKRTLPWDLAAGELDLVSPTPTSPLQAEDIPTVARKKPRLEEPLPTTTDEAAKETAALDISVGLSLSAADDDIDDANTDVDPVSDTQLNAVATTAKILWTSDEDAKLSSAVANTSKKKCGKEHRTDWAAVSALIPGRTKSQCHFRWNYTSDPSIDRAKERTGRWTGDEDSKLTDSVQTHGDKNWVAVAALVQGRTRKQCYSRWKETLDPGIALEAGRTGKWSEDEDSKLRDGVQTHGDKDWDAIARLVPGRTKKQCRDRWLDVLDSSNDQVTGRTGEWAESEDSKLKNAVKMHGGKNWGAIASLVPGRSKKQCHNRWKDALNPSIDQTPGRTGSWAEDEAIKLEEAVHAHGGKNWAAISALVPGRTQRQCYNRWHAALDPNIDPMTARAGR